MELVTQVQILDVAGYISLDANAFEKRYKSISSLNSNVDGNHSKRNKIFNFNFWTLCSHPSSSGGIGWINSNGLTFGEFIF